MPRSTKRARKSSATGSRKKRKVSRNKRIGKAKASVSRDILTDQFDKRVDYVHVKKAVKTKDIAFKNKVMKALATQQPVQTRLFTLSSSATATTTVTEQAWQIFHLKPYQGQAAAPGAGSLYNEVAQNDLLSMGASSGMSDNYWIKQAWMDVYCENTSANDGILEVYELDYVPRAGNPINQYASFNAALTAAIAATTTIGGNAYNLNYRGVTPFDIATLLRDFGIRVVKKMVTDLQSNGRFMYTLKDYRRHYVNADSLAKDLGSKFCVQGMTKSLLCVLKCLQNDGAVTLRASVDKHYRIQPTNDKQDETQGGRD